MPTAVIVLLVVLGVAIVIGSVVAYFAFRKASDGFEDDEGFHPGSRRNKR
jgi:hypothetical protein